MPALARRRAQEHRIAAKPTRPTVPDGCIHTFAERRRQVVLTWCRDRFPAHANDGLAAVNPAMAARSPGWSGGRGRDLHAGDQTGHLVVPAARMDGGNHLAAVSVVWPARRSGPSGRTRRSPAGRAAGPAARMQPSGTRCGARCRRGGPHHGRRQGPEGRAASVAARSMDRALPILGGRLPHVPAVLRTVDA